MDWKGVEERILQDDQDKWDQKVTAQDLRVTRAGALELSDGSGLTGCYSLSDLAAGQMCQRLGIPVGYYWRLPGEMKAPVSRRLLGCRDSSPPVTWLATTMHYSHNEDEIRFDGVKNSLRENARETATNILIEDSPTFWGFENSTDCVLNGLNKPQGKLRITLSVVEGCLPLLLERLRVKLSSHLRTTSRTF
jgi:hypothetical protein